MLNRQLVSVPPKPAEPVAPAEREIGLRELIAFLRRQRWPIAVATGAMVVLGLFYLSLSQPKYTASATLLVDTRRLDIFGKGDVFGDTSISNAALETQVLILRSGRIAEAVVDKLELGKDPSFFGTPGPVSRVIGFFTGLFARPAPVATADQARIDAARRAAAVATLMANTTVGRVGLSYVIFASYTSENPLEATRIADALSAAYIDDQLNAQFNIARRASDWLQASIEELRRQGDDANLTPQERSAVRSTYDAFLQRYTQAVQQESLPVAEARVLTPASPGRKTAPNTLFILAGSLIFGGVLGLGIGLARDLLDRAVRTGQQVEQVTGAPFLGYLPTFDLGGWTMRRIAKRARTMLDLESRQFAAGPAFSVVLTAPFSRFTETLRAVKVAADSNGGKPVNVLGVISSVPNEGKTTVSVNLARVIAHGGARVLLVDGDLRNPVLSRDLVPPKTPGLVQVLYGRAQPFDVIWTDHATPLHFLPAGADGKVSANDLLGSKAHQALIEAYRTRYNVIIFDLPAVLPVVDVRAAAHLFEGFVFVVEWGYTTEETLSQAFHVQGVEERVIGTVLTKVKLSSLKQFGDQLARLPADKYLESYRHTA
jgi:capsular exopolysaccharide synthesis family protein